jgi:ABC-type glycerol-3-phosphate transport system substrate-binding protein
VRRLALVLVAVLLLAACGGGSKSGEDATAQIKSAYEQFFSSDTSLSTRVALLQNGPRFKSVISALASNPLASDTSATVSSVKLEGADQAKVVFTVNVSGNPLLENKTGTAVRTGGKWKVGYASLCKLIALEGSPPAACSSG